MLCKRQNSAETGKFCGLARNSASLAKLWSLIISDLRWAWYKSCLSFHRYWLCQIL